MIEPRNLGLISYRPGTVSSDAKVDLCFECAEHVGAAVAYAMTDHVVAGAKA